MLLGAATTITHSEDTTPDSDPDNSTPATTAGGEVPTGIGGTRDTPVPVGQIADIGGGWRLQVLDAIPNASEQMAAADEFFDPAPAGSTYMLVKLALGFCGTDDPRIGFEPDVDFFNHVFSGGVVIGNACCIAPLAEAGTFQPMAALTGPQPGAASTAARLAPTPVGTTTSVGPDWQITVTGAARDITNEVLAENDFNEPPPGGYRYVGVEMTFTYNGAGGASPAQVSIGSVGADNVQHDGYCGLVPGEIELFTDLFAGGSASGTKCLVVRDDGSATALFATADFNGFIWFATS